MIHVYQGTWNSYIWYLYAYMCVYTCTVLFFDVKKCLTLLATLRTWMHLLCSFATIRTIKARHTPAFKIFTIQMISSYVLLPVPISGAPVNPLFSNQKRQDCVLVSVYLTLQSNNPKLFGIVPVKLWCRCNDNFFRFGKALPMFSGSLPVSLQTFVRDPRWIEWILGPPCWNIERGNSPMM